MTRTATARWAPALATVLLALAIDAPARGDGFKSNVRPLVQKHCLRCHGEKKPKGDINLAKLADEESLRGDPELWVQVVDALAERSMPPPGDKAGPNEDERTPSPGRHVAYAKDTPLCNLYVSMLARVGTPVERFADSTGPLPGLDNPEYKSPSAS